jgi:hypothetical protein
LARGNIAVNHYPELPCIGTQLVPVQGIFEIVIAAPLVSPAAKSRFIETMSCFDQRH